MGEIWDKAKEIGGGIIEGGKDTVEVIRLAGEFKDVYEAEKYFEDNQEDIRSIGIRKIWKDPEGVRESLEEVNRELDELNAALEEMNRLGLQFSEPFLGAEFKRLRKTVQRFANWKGDTFRDLVDSGKVDWIAGKEKEQDLADLSLTMADSDAKIEKFYTNLDSLIDPELEEYSNNMVLNEALEGIEFAEDANRLYEVYKKLEEYGAL